MKWNKKFRKNTKYPHKRSEGLTRRGEVRQARLMLGRKGWGIRPHSFSQWLDFIGLTTNRLRDKGE